MATGIDHVVILSDDLDKAVDQYRKLGFTVTPGGKHPRFTHNALIPFADGSYIELISFYERPTGDAGESHRWYRHLETGGGLVDFAIDEPNLDTLIADADALGATHQGPNAGARKRPDNQEIAWKTATPREDQENTGALPFVITDVTDRSLRVPADSHHENGARGIMSIAIVVRDLDAAVERYCKLLQRDEPSEDTLPNLDNARGVYFLVGSHRIDVATPAGPGSLQTHLDRHGDSPYELAMLAPINREFDPAEAAGARVRLVAG